MPLAESVLVSIVQEVKFQVEFCGANIGWSEVRDGITMIRISPTR